MRFDEERVANRFILEKVTVFRIAQNVVIAHVLALVESLSWGEAKTVELVFSQEFHAYFGTSVHFFCEPSFPLDVRQSRVEVNIIGGVLVGTFSSLCKKVPAHHEHSKTDGCPEQELRWPIDSDTVWVRLDAQYFCVHVERRTLIHSQGEGSEGQVHSNTVF